MSNSTFESDPRYEEVDFAEEARWAIFMESFIGPPTRDEYDAWMASLAQDADDFLRRCAV